MDNPNTKSKPTTVAEHFLSSYHTFNDMQLIPIEKVFSNRDSIRKAREAFLILKGRTIDPEGLNIREETYYFIYLYCFISYFTILVYFYFILHCQFNYLYVFPGLRKIPQSLHIKHPFQCNFPLCLKKAGLASRNILHQI